MTNRNGVGYVEVGMNHFFPGGHGHRGMVVGPAEVHLVAVLQADERIVGGHLRIVAVSVRLRHTVQLPPTEAVGSVRGAEFWERGKCGDANGCEGIRSG